MMESLDELRKDIESAGGTFLFCYGNTSKVLKYLVSKLDIHAVGYNLDYSPRLTLGKYLIPSELINNCS